MTMIRVKLPVIIYIVFLNVIMMISSTSMLNTLVDKYEAIVENLEIDRNGTMRATKEISTNKQILIIPTAKIISSEENYQFKEYFSRSNKEKLVGRLLIEKFIGNASYYYEFIESLPKANDMQDYYHYSEDNKIEFEKRSLLKYSWNDRRNEYETLIRKIPSNEIPSLLLNLEVYNWARSIVDMYGILMKKKYYSEVKRLSRLSTNLDPNSNEEVVLIPGINIFEGGPFKSLSGNNLQSSLFAYKEHIYLNSDRYIDEMERVYNDLQFIPNIKLFQISGKFLPGFHHEEMHLAVDSKGWTLKKFDLCKELDCLPKSSNYPQFTLKYEFNLHLLNYCQIDQLEDKDEASVAYKILKSNRKISESNYVKSLAKCSRIIKDFIKIKKKTSIAQDIKDILNKTFRDEKEKNIIGFAVSQKKILFHHIRLFNNRLIKELQNDLFVNIKKKFV